MHTRPLYIYVIGVAVVWAILLTFSWFGDIWKPFHNAISVCGGFWIGMLAMYIAVHLYKWK
jgi:hypothetical protein